MSGAITHWWRQRLSSVLLIPLSIWLLWAGVAMTGAEYQAAVDFIGHPVNAIIAVLTIAIAMYHTQAGITVIVEDYIPGKAFPLFLVWITRIGCTIGVLAALVALYSIAFGA